MVRKTYILISFVLCTILIAGCTVQQNSSGLLNGESERNIQYTGDYISPEEKTSSQLFRSLITETFSQTADHYRTIEQYRKDYDWNAVYKDAGTLNTFLSDTIHSYRADITREKGNPFYDLSDSEFILFNKYIAFLNQVQDYTQYISKGAHLLEQTVATPESPYASEITNTDMKRADESLEDARTTLKTMQEYCEDLGISILDEKSLKIFRIQ